MALGEFELIAKYFGAHRGRVPLGVGDDAAVITPGPGRDLVVAADMMVEGVHFFPGADPEALGHKILAVNLSDMAAMGARPRWATLALAMPEADAGWLAAFARGFFDLADRHDVALVGGDTTRGPLNLCVQILGEIEPGQALRRDGARNGDEIWVSGELGAAALAVSHRKGDVDLPDALAMHCSARLDRPTPRVPLGRALRGVAHAAIDVSDGLVADLGHVCTQSGVGAHVDAGAVPRRRELEAALGAERVLRAALTGGDDYELCFTASPDDGSQIQALVEAVGLPLTRVGWIVEGKEVKVHGRDGECIETGRGGHDHFG